jgi:hypothetical protein
MKLFTRLGAIFLLMDHFLASDAKVEGINHRDLYGGRAGGMGMGNGGGDGWNGERMQIIQKLLEHRGVIERIVTSITEDGQEKTMTETTSENPEVEQWIITHVTQMIDLVQSGGRIRNWDPLFRAIFDHAEEIDSDVTVVDGGVEVLLTGTTDCGKALADKHAKLVSAFLADGYEELHRPHQAPRICDA